MKKLYILVLTFISITVFAQYTFTVYNPSNSGVGSYFIGDIKVDANGLLWMATYEGVSTFNGTTFTNYTTANSGIASNAIIKIEIDGLGKKWMASQNNGIILRNGTTWTNYTIANSGLPNNAINDIAVDGLNNLWIATANGLTKFNGTTWTTYTSLTNINSVATDSSNGVWVTNSFGVLYKFNGTDFNTVFQGLSKILKIANNTIYCDSGDGLMTFTTSGTYLGTQYQSNSCLSGYQFKALDVDSNNKVWIGFGGTGLQNFTNCTSYTVANSDLPMDDIRSLKTLSSGTIWVGTSQGGLVKMTPSATTCNAPTQFWSSSITSTTAAINWIPSTSAPNGGYLYVYNTTPTVGGLDGSSFSTTADLTNLAPNTTYYWWVAANCVTSQSDWALGGSFTTLPAATGCWQKISSGDYHNVGIKSDGTLWTWGVNYYGQLGNGNTSDTISPIQIGTETNWQSVSAGGYSTFAIKTDGSLWAWGYNNFGQLGDGTLINRTIPTRIGTATNWQVVESSGNHTLAIKTNGTLWAWGNNNLGQLGDGTGVNKVVPTQVGTSTNWQKLALGDLHSLAIKTNGTLWAWGFNGTGQLGIGAISNGSFIPLQVDSATDWQQIAAGSDFSLAKKVNGIVYSWGINDFGQLGDGTTTIKLVPTAVFDQIQNIGAGNYHTLVTTTNGRLYAWGRNGDGQLGDGTSIDKHTPTLIGTATNWVSATGGNQHSMAIKTTGSVSVFGYNGNGQLGLGYTSISVNTPVAISCPTTLDVTDFTSLANNVRTYPNPVKNSLNLSFEKEISTVSIFNFIGQEVMTKSLNSKEGSIDVSNLASGTYMVKITSNDEVQTTKIIKE